MNASDFDWGAEAVDQALAFLKAQHAFMDGVDDGNGDAAMRALDDYRAAVWSAAETRLLYALLRWIDTSAQPSDQLPACCSNHLLCWLAALRGTGAIPRDWPLSSSVDEVEHRKREAVD